MQETGYMVGLGTGVLLECASDAIDRAAEFIEQVAGLTAELG